MSRVLVAGDLHHPFCHEDYLIFLKAIRRKYRTTETVFVGDELDLAAISDYEHDPDGFAAGHELIEAINNLEPYYKAFPRVKICHSNHTARILKRAFKSGIPKACIKELREILNAPRGWEWKDHWEIDDVIYLHGMGYSGTLGALNAAMDKHKSCVIGHLHSDSGILYRSNGKETIYGMNVGCGIDAKAYAFNYGKDSRKKPILSCGVVIDGKPYLEIMTLDKKGRWDWSL